MLQVIRSKATSFVIKILFGLLIVSFGVWGIGDIFRDRGVDNTAATVGDQKITVEQVNQAVRADMDRLRRVLGGNIDLEQAKQMGIVDGALQRLISSDLVDLEINRMGLTVGDEAVRQAILGNPNFKNDQGVFDRDIYNRVLAANRMSGAQFEALLRHEIAKSYLTGALTNGITPPQTLVDTLYRARAEKRVADVATLPPSAAGEIPAPTEAELAAYYDQHKERFRTPELRSFTVATLRLDDVAATIKVPEDKLKTAYQNRLDEFHVPEQRQLEQMLLPDEAKAKQAEQALAAGKDFAAVAKDLTNAAPETLDLGWVKRADLPSALGDAAFSLKEGETSKPVQTSFGWHVLRVTGIKPEQTQPFDEVKNKLAHEIAHDQAGDEIAETANHIEDAIAGGASLADLTKKFGLKTVVVEGVDLNGRNADGKPIGLPQPSDTILHTAFDTQSGQMSQLTEMGEDGYYIVRVDKVTPTTIKPLAQVHDQATKLWQAEQRNKALAKLADQIAADVNGGKSLKEVAEARKLTVTTTEPLLRTGGDAKVPPALVAKLFEAKPKAAVTAPSGDGYAVAQLDEIQTADPAKDKSAVIQLTNQLDAVMRNDMLVEFDKALRRVFPVEINQSNLDRLL